MTHVDFTQRISVNQLEKYRPHNRNVNKRLELV